LASRTVADNAKGRPELLRSTAMDISAQKKLKKLKLFLGALKTVTSAAKYQNAKTPRWPTCPEG